MNPELTSRRNVLRVGAVAAFGVLSQTSPVTGQQTPPPERKGPKPMDLDLVRDFVGACHRDLDTVKSILKREPGVVNASFNRGGGDWERGMEAAAHMGRPDIADVLIAHKARKCIFWAAMAGEESIVRAFVSADPETVNTGGAHNISLMAHAAICGKISLTQFLQDNGARVDNKSLEHAVRGNRIQMVEWLVENGANPGAKDIFGNFHYDTAEKRGFSEIASFLKARAGV